VGIEQIFAGIATTDHEAAFGFYERVLGKPPDMLPTDGEAVWQVAGAGWIYVVADPARAGRGLLTLMVDDLETHVAGLRGRGLAPGAIETVPGLFSKAELTDLDGNRVTFAQALSSGPPDAG
jgi:hypothetical protein